MPIQLKENNDEESIAVHVSGKLVKDDYEHFVPEFERLVGIHGKLRILFDMTDFHGWTAGAVWEDTKFAMHHFTDIERLAMIGQKNGKKGWQVSANRLPRQPSNTTPLLLRLGKAREWLLEP